MRKQLKYPPFCDIIMIGITGEIEKEVIQSSNNIYEYIKEEVGKLNIENISIIKPLPAPIDKIKNRYRWRIIIKTKVTDEIIEILNKSLSNFYAKNKNSKTRVIIDINPMNMM